MKKPALAALALLAAAGGLAWLSSRPPVLRVRVETHPTGMTLWMNGQPMGASPLEIDAPNLQSDASAPDAPPRATVNTIFGRESVVELDCFLGRWKSGRLRFEAGEGALKRQIETLPFAPEVERTGWRRYRVVLRIRAVP